MAMKRPLVSIITPTFGRPQCLPLIHRCVLRQTTADFEWLVLDDSPEPSAYMRRIRDARVRYQHRPERSTIGAKRNSLVDQARGEIIAQFDDDDFYARHYLSRMISDLNGRRADIVKLTGYFLFSKLHNLFGYWDLTVRRGPHLVVGNEPLGLFLLDDTNNAEFADMHLGFGFSYVFRKAVWGEVKFPDRDWNEDGAFMKEAASRFKLSGVDDAACSCLHILHETNTSRCFPQHVLPRFLLETLFPHCQPYILGGKNSPMP
jgi:glycosyltransferase involved in cell wall biosynthesis